MKHLTILLLLFFFFGISKVSASEHKEFQQKDDYYTRFVNYDASDGLSSSLVLDILQDKYGIMWFATDNGLTRFDGRNFSIYRNEGKPGDISSNFIITLSEDIYGNLWVGTRNGLNRYNRTSNNFTVYRHEKNNPHSISNDRIKRIFADSKGFLWVESWSPFLDKIDIKKNTVEHASHSFAEIEGDYYYHPIIEDSKGTIWISGRFQLMSEIKNGDIDHIHTHSVDANCIVETPQGQIWDIHDWGQVVEYDPKKRKWEKIFKISSSSYDALFDRKGRMWVGGWSGLISIDFNQNLLTKYKGNPDNKQSITSGIIHALYEDRSGNIWIGSEKGVSMYSERLNVFRHYRQINKMENGLTSNHVSALLQDNSGLIWVGTKENGTDTLNLHSEKAGNISYNLLRQDLDKATFEKEKELLKQYADLSYISPKDGSLRSDHLFDNYDLFKKTPLKFRSANENIVNSLYQDKEGDVYIGLWANLGFNIYNKNTKTIKRRFLYGGIDDTPFNPGANPSGANWYSGFAEDSRGGVWCAIWEALGMCLYDKKKGDFTGEHFMPSQRFGSPGVIQYDAVRKRLYCGADLNYRYFDLEKKTGIWYNNHIPTDARRKAIFNTHCEYANLPERFQCVGMIYDGKNHIWLSGIKQIFKHDLSSGRIEEFFHKKGEILHYNLPIASSSDKKYIWMIFEGEIKRLQTSNKNTITLSEKETSITKNDSLKNCSFQCIHEDMHGKLWIGSSIGVYAVDAGQDHFYYVPLERLKKRNTLASATVIRSDASGNVWIGGKFGVIVLQNGKEKAYYPFGTKSENSALTGSDVTDIFFDHAGDAWIGTNGGLVQLAPQTGKIKLYEFDPKKQYSILSNAIRSICEDENMDIWVSTLKGICQLERKTGCFIDYSQPNEGCLTSRLATCIIADRNGDIWLGTEDSGVNKVNTVTGKVTYYLHHSWDSLSLSHNNIECLFEDKEGNIWIGTEDGLNRLVNEKHIDRFDLASGLPGNNIKGISQDLQGRIWVSTNNGLCCIDPKSKKIRNFNYMDELKKSPFSMACCQLSDGKLAFGSDNGFFVFNPDEVLKPISPAPITFSNFKVWDKLYFFDMNEVQSIELDPSDNSLSIDFTALDYEQRKHLKYRYQLKNFDKNWNEANADGLTAKYTNLPHGNYVFTVECSDVYGNWVTTRSIPILIKTPWYYQWWFFLLMAASLIGIVFYIIRFREKKLRKDNEQLEKTISSRTFELKEANQKLSISEDELKKMVETKNSFFSIISHDLRGPLHSFNNILDSIYQRYENSEEKKEEKGEIKLIRDQASKIKDLLENLLAWAQVQKSEIVPRTRTLDLHQMITSEIAMQQLTAGIKEIQLINQVPATIQVEGDENMMSFILRNLTSNAIKYSYPGGRIVFSSCEKDSMIEVSVTDEGTGISKEDQLRLFHPGFKFRKKGTRNETGNGVGLILCKEYIEKQGGTISVESAWEKGSVFKFTVKK